MCLPPCHVLSQAFASDVREVRRLRPGEPCVDRWLDLHFHMRSLDVFLGMPFDVASHALVLSLLAREVGREPRMLIMTSGDTHLYRNHLLQADEARSRRPFPQPELSLTDDASLLKFEAGAAWLSGYEHHPAIYAPMNV
jgi:thymidylate synthase